MLSYLYKKSVVLGVLLDHIKLSSYQATRTQQALLHPTKTNLDNFFNTTLEMAQQQYEWLVQLPDKPNGLHARLDNLEAHLNNITPQVEAGKITMRGFMFSVPPANPADAQTKISGSVHVVKASTEEEIWQLVKADPYTMLGVWDLEKATVSPMKVGIMKPM